MARLPTPQQHLGDLASAEVLRSVAAEAAALLPAGARPAPTADAVMPAAAGACDLLRTALVDLESAYAMYLQRSRGPGRGRSDARRATLGSERHAAERRDPRPADGVGQGRAALTKPAGGIPRYRPVRGPALFAAGFRPFFLAAGVWAVAGDWPCGSRR